MDISEKTFEAVIETALLGGGPVKLLGGASPGREASPAYGLVSPGGCRKRVPEAYDRGLSQDTLDFILAMQAEEWTKLKQHHAAAFC
jgi:hypothetical protein